MLRSLDKNLNKLYKFSGYIAAIFLILVAVFILIGISSRIFGFYIRGLAEYSGYCMASASFFALSLYFC
jgi:TRAP-type C4-dicarboxylate transport system permease small subunit